MTSVKCLVKDQFGCFSLVIVGLLLCIFGYLAWPWPFGTTPEEHRVLLTTEGFVPEVTRVKVGDTVVFRTNTGEDFWPASDTHPSHSAYPDFDPLGLIASGSNWSYTFTEPGRYAYHDHINPLARAVIVVGETTADTSMDNCEAEPSTTCWQNLILTALDEGGIAVAFAKLVQLSEAEPTFLRDCHDYRSGLKNLSDKVEWG